jgi:hypothetical protein
MTDFAVMVLAGGLGEIRTALPYALAWALLAIAVFFGAGFVLLFMGRGRRRRRGCPCCTGEPYRNNDCTCREDCGVYWCQAADIDDALEANRG